MGSSFSTLVFLAFHSLVLVGAWVVLVRSPRYGVFFRLFFFLVVISQLWVVTVPYAARLFLPNMFFDDAVTKTELNIVLIMEALSLAVWLGVISIGTLGLRSRAGPEIFEISLTSRKFRVIALVLFSLALVLQADEFIDAAVSLPGQPLYSGWVIRLARSLALVYVASAIVSKDKSKYSALLIAMAILQLAPYLANGSRGPWFLVFSYVAGLLVILRFSWVAGSLALLAITLPLVWGATLHAMRSDHRGVDDGLSARISTFEKYLSDGADGLKDKGRDLFEEMIWRAGEASRVSVGFLRLHSRGESGGWTSASNSLNAVFPRAWWPDKPVSGSSDGTKFGAAVYLVHGEIYNQPENMSEVYSGPLEFWEFGVFGLALGTLISAAFWIMLLRWSSTNGVIGGALLLAVENVNLFTPKIWVSEIVIVLITMVIPVAVTLFIFKRAARLRW